MEEAGIKAKSIKPFAVSVVGTTVKWDLHYFVVDDFEVAKQDLELGEVIAAEWKSYEDARSLCLAGGVSEERSALQLLRYLNKS